MRFGPLGAPELILIVLAIVLIFGASKLGDIGGAVGKSIREFRKEANVPEPDKQDSKESIEASAPEAPPAPPSEDAKTPVGVGDFRPPSDKTS